MQWIRNNLQCVLQKHAASGLHVVSQYLELHGSTVEQKQHKNPVDRKLDITTDFSRYDRPV